MSTFFTHDGIEIYYKDWGSGKPVLFSHGWPLDADMWEYQMEYLSSRGYRTIAFDRRGFGRSEQPWHGYDYDTFADDIAQLIKHLDLREVTLVGFSMGGGDVSRYIARHGSERVAGLVLLGAVTPLFGQKADFPQGVDKSVFDGIKAGLLKDRAQFIA
ncbi:alpha/beta hydrolase, partial [Pseudomonas sp. HMWF005]